MMMAMFGSMPSDMKDKMSDLMHVDLPKFHEEYQKVYREKSHYNLLKDAY